MIVTDDCTIRKQSMKLCFSNPPPNLNKHILYASLNFARYLNLSSESILSVQHLQSIETRIYVDRYKSVSRNHASKPLKIPFNSGIDRNTF